LNLFVAYDRGHNVRLPAETQTHALQRIWRSVLHKSCYISMSRGQFLGKFMILLWIAYLLSQLWIMLDIIRKWRRLINITRRKEGRWKRRRKWKWFFIGWCHTWYFFPTHNGRSWGWRYSAGVDAVLRGHVCKPLRHE